MRIKLSCPSNCINDVDFLFGSKIYPDLSRICITAAHAGQIDEKGGQFKVDIVEPLVSYNGELNGKITSKNFGGKTEFAFKIYNLKGVK